MESQSPTGAQRLHVRLARLFNGFGSWHPPEPKPGGHQFQEPAKPTMVDLREPSGTLHSQPSHPAAQPNHTNGPTPVLGSSGADRTNILVEPWMMTEDDVDWAHTLGRKRYDKKFDSITTEGWFRNIVLKQPVLFYPCRTPNAFCISMLSILPWLPSEVECNVVFICCEEGAMWEGLKCLRASVEWGRQRKCTVWRLCSDTDYDLKMLGQRLGCTELSPRYVLRY